MGDFDCGAIDCGDIDCGDCCDECFDCCDEPCFCFVCFSDAISGKALLRILCGLVIFAVLAAVVTLLVIALVPRRVGVSVEDAALADKNATATALAYDISIAVAVHNRAVLHGAVLRRRPLRPRRAGDLRGRGPTAPQ
uniref:Uncharacterized protein n=1 Tax=Aegilops tauschii TaxID=37682 RepID=M8AVB4_AEGTA